MENGLMDQPSRAQLPWFIALSQVIGLSVVVITGVWMGHYRGGFAWDGSSLEFNVHPLCMVIGIVFLYGDAIMVFRIFQNESKAAVKILHGIIQLIGLIATIIGLVAVFEFHMEQKNPDMYSLHSWCGLITVILFGLQWLMGLVFFLFPGASNWLRAKYKPLHVFFGLTLFLLAIATALLGITEKLLFSISDGYSKQVPEGILANVLGLLLVGFGLTVGYVVTRSEWKRPPNPEDEPLSMHFKTLTECDSPDSQQ
ncbi:transmembrane ascorbate-dependent reductase CYB561 [Callorhinchus milii]|uniref:Transmembrane ascorbate-dependent reductase CYB561 n=2 Tax=Callorhinchus milii TaxID=7868 RepID=A0A4W3HSR4_CALMI|nr:transmembrane ascorbate-dependent reductase CYB561 [Callorhinchus milii]XP_007905534.1 transmembrane ascorbate-dependent reductase CYB561 [Callorhinchus milii]|eukprot:gi/632977770/ref/XP_007905533.1/ PREDICTED: cytochrome b561 [Callorhinchus milii]